MIEGFVKMIVGLVAFIYLFGALYFSNDPYSLIYGALALGLVFRLTFNLRRSPSWKVLVAFIVCFSVIVQRIAEYYFASTDWSEVFSSLSTFLLIVPIVSVAMLDAWKLRETAKAAI